MPPHIPPIGDIISSLLTLLGLPIPTLGFIEGSQQSGAVEEDDEAFGALGVAFVAPLDGALSIANFDLTSARPACNPD